MLAGIAGLNGKSRVIPTRGRPPGFLRRHRPRLLAGAFDEGNRPVLGLFGINISRFAMADGITTLCMV